MPRVKPSFTFIDLFAGIGGIRIAFENIGGECVFSSEWDTACQETYRANFGETPAGDITKIDANDIPDHDILTGGFPCQSFSIIGKRQGLRDSRGTLFFDVERILKAKRPKAFLLENVKQLTTIDNGLTFQTMLGKLKELGYFLHWKVLNALDYGIPQKRERVLIVGFQKDYPFRFPEPVKERAPLSSILEPHDSVPAKYFLSETAAAKLSQKVLKRPAHPTIWHENKSGHIGIHEYSCALRANASYNYLLVDGLRRPTPREQLRLMGFPDSYKIVVNDSHIRKQAGNSVVVPVVQSVARQMAQAMGADLYAASERKTEAVQQTLWEGGALTAEAA